MIEFAVCLLLVQLYNSIRPFLQSTFRQHFRLRRATETRINSLSKWTGGLLSNGSPLPSTESLQHHLSRLRLHNANTKWWWNLFLIILTSDQWGICFFLLHFLASFPVFMKHNITSFFRTDSCVFYWGLLVGLLIHEMKQLKRSTNEKARQRC